MVPLSQKNVIISDYSIMSLTRTTVPYSNGDVYIGEVNCIKNGKGRMDYTNGDIYEGNWIDDKRNGLGTIKYKTEMFIMVNLKMINKVKEL